MIVKLDPAQLEAILGALGAFVEQLRRLNGNLEAGRAHLSPAPDAPTAPRPGAPS